jgi:hypothetical protein
MVRREVVRVFVIDLTAFPSSRQNNKRLMNKIVLAGLLVFIVSCQKENNTSVKKKSATELLTQKAWVLTTHGFDDNNNGVIDPTENLIRDCEKDNSYVFKNTGIATVFENTISCGGSDQSDFDWKLLNGDTKLLTEFETSSILRLDENELILNPDFPGLNVKYFLFYRH